MVLLYLAGQSSAEKQPAAVLLLQMQEAAPGFITNKAW
jgi:hypothetical protein